MAKRLEFSRGMPACKICGIPRQCHGRQDAGLPRTYKKGHPYSYSAGHTSPEFLCGQSLAWARQPYRWTLPRADGGGGASCSQRRWHAAAKTKIIGDLDGFMPGMAVLIYASGQPTCRPQDDQTQAPQQGKAAYVVHGHM